MMAKTKNKTSKRQATATPAKPAAAGITLSVAADSAAANPVACFPESTVVPPPPQPAVEGLRFGDPNGLTNAEKDQNGDLLRAYAKKYAVQLGFRPGLFISVGVVPPGVPPGARRQPPLRSR